MIATGHKISFLLTSARLPHKKRVIGAVDSDAVDKNNDIVDYVVVDSGTVDKDKDALDIMFQPHRLFQLHHVFRECQLHRVFRECQLYSVSQLHHVFRLHRVHS